MCRARRLHRGRIRPAEGHLQNRRLWFDKNGYFQARGYVFEQTDTENDTKKYLTPIDQIEKRAGVDFFPLLKDYIENLVEGKTYTTIWGTN